MRKAAVTTLLLLASCTGGGNSDPGSVTTTALTTVPPAPEAPTSTTEAPTTTVEVTTTTEVEATTPPTTVRVIPATPTTIVKVFTSQVGPLVAEGNCGGSLPPCSVMMAESRGSLTVYNYEGSGASGKWQIMPGTWNGYGGYANAADAPESVQDAKARELWNGGRGCWHWSAC